MCFLTRLAATMLTALGLAVATPAAEAHSGYYARPTYYGYGYGPGYYRPPPPRYYARPVYVAPPGYYGPPPRFFGPPPWARPNYYGRRW